MHLHHGNISNNTSAQFSDPLNYYTINLFVTVLVGSNPLMRTNCTTQNLTTTTTTTELVETTPTTITVSVTSQTVLAGDPSSGATKSSKSQVILAVSLSSIALLLIIVVAVGIAAIRKRRYASVCFIINFDCVNLSRFVDQYNTHANRSYLSTIKTNM